MQRNQIHLKEKSIEQNRDFLKALYGEPLLEDARRWFDKSNTSGLRERDSNMDLETFLGLMNPSFYIVLQTGSPFPDRIRYCATGSDKPVDGSNIYAWVQCPFSEHNCDTISRLFKDVYGQDLDSIPVPDNLIELHKQFN